MNTNMFTHETIIITNMFTHETIIITNMFTKNPQIQNNKRSHFIERFLKIVIAYTANQKIIIQKKKSKKKLQKNIKK